MRARPKQLPKPIKSQPKPSPKKSTPVRETMYAKASKKK